MTTHCHGGSYDNCIEMVPIFSNLTHGEMAEIAAITKAQTFGKGQMIYMAGDQGGKLYDYILVKLKFPA